MEIEKNDMVMVYDGGGTVPHCKYTGRFGDLTAYWQEIVSDAVYLFRLGESEEALAAAEAFISTHGNEVNDEEDGIGSVIYWTVEVERRVEYKENEWLPCDESGRIDDGYGNEPNATVAYLSSLEGSREERAFELAKNEYLAWLEHKADRYTTVYGYMD